MASLILSHLRLLFHCSLRCLNVGVSDSWSFQGPCGLLLFGFCVVKWAQTVTCRKR